MKDFSLPALCESVIQGLDFSGISTQERINFSYTEGTDIVRGSAANGISNLLYLLFSYLLSESEIETSEVTWSIKKKDPAEHLLYAYIVVRTKDDARDFNFSGFLNCKAVNSVSRHIGGRASEAGKQALEICLPLDSSPAPVDIPLDIDEMQKDFEDISLCRSIIQEYLDKRDEYLGLILQGLAAEDFSAVHRAAHSIKGGALNLRAKKLSLAAQELEHQARAGRIIDGSRHIEKLREEFLRVTEYFNRISHKEAE